MQQKPFRLIDKDRKLSGGYPVWASRALGRRALSNAALLARSRNRIGGALQTEGMPLWLELRPE
jgi:hypothetical protein